MRLEIHKILMYIYYERNGVYADHIKPFRTAGA